MCNAVFLPCDTDRSGTVEPTDVLVVINELRRDGTRNVSLDAEKRRVDANQDGWISPIDALVVINTLRRHQTPLQLALNTSPESDPNGNGVILGESVAVMGQSLSRARIEVTISSGSSAAPLIVLTTSADDQGAFTVQLPLSFGANKLTFKVYDQVGRTLELIRELGSSDIVTEWNAAILNVVRDWTTVSNDPYEGRIVPSQPPMVARNLAMIHTAMFDAINAVEGIYQGYALNIDSQPTASAIAAGATAAYAVASFLYPDADERAVWNATLMESLASIPDDAARNAGVAIGHQASAAMLALRRDDVKNAASIYSIVDSPGHWNRTSPDNLPPLLPSWPHLKPFALISADQFRPVATPTLDSPEYATAVDEVMRLGSFNSTERTADQTEIALFWADGGGTATPPGHWNRIATDVLMAKGVSLLESAKTLALLNIAMADAGIASWDAKYHYDLWRPIDAIREADQGGNSATIADTTWIPLLKTPPFPSYTSGHSTFSGAAAAVLTELFGNDLSFTSPSDSHSGLQQRPLDQSLITTRTFANFESAALEAGQSRIYGGIHFNFDNDAGLELGSQIGKWVMSSFLR